ncbi:DUF177 domain-containing protein [Pacificimonas sp. WHA3]|uniref:DUF177 domain-containing protein n=1 Tax=Pacificimonas pallii TaxID=2827236 RepID=A0ABS6SCQ1_9SPHN|nr:DUF177 domain-containing protein [Pacificimonas pallii]MBV7256197.1 DUF177 domain-containing protein [Pacificimonas pallii]
MIPEFSRPIRLDEIGGGVTRTLNAKEEECAALARRFGLVAITALTAKLAIAGEGRGIRISGSMTGDAVASCSISAEDVAQHIAETIDILAVKEDAAHTPDEEIELASADLDIVHIEDGRIDLGEIIAASFALALDPFPRAGDDVIAAARLHLLSEEEAAAEAQAAKEAASPFAALKPGD